MLISKVDRVDYSISSLLPFRFPFKPFSRLKHFTLLSEAGFRVHICSEDLELLLKNVVSVFDSPSACMWPARKQTHLASDTSLEDLCAKQGKSARFTKPTVKRFPKSSDCLTIDMFPFKVAIFLYSLVNSL